MLLVLKLRGEVDIHLVEISVSTSTYVDRYNSGLHSCKHIVICFDCIIVRQKIICDDS